MKINSLADLKQEKLLLKAKADTHIALIQADMEHIKKALSPLSILKNIVPGSVQVANVIRGPLDKIGKMFDRKTDPNAPHSAADDEKAAKRAHIKEVALNLVETAASVALSRFVRRRF